MTMQPKVGMRAPVDVLAVLDAEIERAGFYAFPSGRNLIRARAAVAELVEAARRVNGDHVAPHDCYATGPLTGDPVRDLVSCPGCELAAALAKFGVKA